MRRYRIRYLSLRSSGEDFIDAETAEDALTIWKANITLTHPPRQFLGISAEPCQHDWTGYRDADTGRVHTWCSKCGGKPA